MPQKSFPLHTYPFYFKARYGMPSQKLPAV